MASTRYHQKSTIHTDTHARTIRWRHVKSSKIQTQQTGQPIDYDDNQLSYNIENIFFLTNQFHISTSRYTLTVTAMLETLHYSHSNFMAYQQQQQQR